MSEKMIENNKVRVTGEIVSGFAFSHEVFGEGFYLMDVAMSRLSDQVDIVPLTIPERLINIDENYKGCTAEVQGQFRSYNRHEEAKNRPVFSIFVREITFTEEFMDYTKINQISLDGYICKVSIYRKTPLGRETVDPLAAVNRPYGKSDYTLYIAWGRNARYASGFEVGVRVKLWGRVQSWECIEKISDNGCEKRIIYKVSANRLESGEAEMREEM